MDVKDTLASVRCLTSKPLSTILFIVRSFFAILIVCFCLSYMLVHAVLFAMLGTSKVGDE